jgi:hypothetical protein
MTRPPLAAVFQALHTRLTSPATEPWGTRAFPTLAPAGAARPYVVYWHIGGGLLPARGQMRANVLVGVKVVAPTLGQAFVAAGRLTDLLHDTGTHDTSDTPLNGGDDWSILTATVEQPAISMREEVDGVPVFHEGIRLRLFLEERP